MDTSNPPRYRPLLPGSTPPTIPPGPKLAPKAKRNQVIVACELCRARKSKCDGARPSCARCISMGSFCQYSADPDAVPIVSLRRKLVAAERRTEQLEDLLDTLTQSPEHETLEMVRRWRGMSRDARAASSSTSASASAPASATSTLAHDLEMVNQGVKMVSVNHSSRGTEDGLSPDSKPPELSHLLEASPVMDGNGTLDSFETSSPQFGPCSGASESSEQLAREFGDVDIVANIEHIRYRVPSLRDGYHAFLESTGVLFDSYTLQQAHFLLESALHDPINDMSTSDFCEVCIVAAVSSQYSPTEAGPNDFEHHIYRSSQMLLPDCIKANPLGALKVCALLVMYNINIGSKEALTYVGWGLDLAAKQGIDGNDPSAFELQTWLEAKRVWRTLIFCNEWLETTLGFHCRSVDSCAETTFSADDLGGSPATTDTDYLQIEITKVSVLKADFLRSVSRRSISMESIMTLDDGLQAWYSSLPDGVSMENLKNMPHEDRTSTVGRLTFYVHLIHLSAMMLLHRRILSEALMSGQEEDPQNVVLTQQTRSWTKNGILAAQRSAQITAIMHEEGGLQCWMCMFQAYRACCILLYDAFQKLLYGADASQWSEYLDPINRCIDALRQDAKADPVARRFHRALKLYTSLLMCAQDPLATKYAQSHRPSTPPDTRSSEYMFVRPKGDTLFHHAARHLLLLTCGNYGSKETMAILDQPMIAH